jgi:hypothetical protein
LCESEIDMAAGKGYELVPQSVPPRRRSNSSFYRAIIDEFLRSNEKSALIAGTDRRPVTLVQGLRKTLEKDEITGVSVSQRTGEVYLIKEETQEPS